MIVVTSGAKYMDIDAYASAIAYAELLNLSGNEAVAATSSVLNDSIPEAVKKWGAKIHLNYNPTSTDQFVIIDVSDYHWLDSMADIKRVIEIIDHHPGFEQYWADKIGSKAQIEFIGAASTLIYERWKKSKLVGKLPKITARLLTSGILDNTLNFSSTIATKRDMQAYRELSEIAELPQNWPSTYFSACQEAILKNPSKSLINDSKIMNFKTYSSPIWIGQLVIWEAHSVISKHLLDLIKAVPNQKDWFINIVSISDISSYFVCQDAGLYKWLKALTKAKKVEKDILKADKPWLRKELLKKDLSNV